MKKVLFLIGIVLFSACADNEARTRGESSLFFTEVRGVSYEPKRHYMVSNFLIIDIPKSWENLLEPSPLNKHVAMYGSMNPEHSQIITVRIYDLGSVSNLQANDITNFSIYLALEEIDEKSIARNTLIPSIDQSGAQCILAFFGGGREIGDIKPNNVLCALYYDGNKKIMIKVTTYILFMKRFSDDEWYSLLINVTKIYNSIKLL